VHANDLIINHSRTWKTIEGIAKLFPHLYREAPTTFIIKTVNPINASTFMVSTQKEEIFRVLNFVREQQRDNLQRLFSTINIVPQEKIVCLHYTY